MKRFIRALGPKAEFLIVVVGAFGIFIISNVLGLFLEMSPRTITDEGVRFLLAYESVILGLLAWFLSVRGWTMQRIGLEIGSKGIEVASV